MTPEQVLHSCIPQQKGTSNDKGEQARAKVDRQQNLPQLLPARLPAWVSMGALSFKVSCSPAWHWTQYIAEVKLELASILLPPPEFRD